MREPAVGFGQRLSLGLRRERQRDQADEEHGAHGDAGITERFSAARLDEELDSLALELCGIAEQLGHKTTPAKCRAQCTKGAASGSEVKERLIAKIKAGTEKLITTKEGTK